MTLTFLHIDKTGGMSVRSILADQFDQSAIMPVPHNPYASEKRINYPLAIPDLTKANRLFQFNIKPQYRLVMGHYDWGIIPHIADPVIITVLRNPLDWWLSLYRYICQEVDMYGDLSMQARDLGPTVFAQRCPIRYHNAQTAQLAGIRWTGGGMVGPDAYNEARRNLEHCHYVGVTEVLDDFVADVCVGQDWDIPTTPRHNVTRYAATVDAETEAIIRENCQYDYLLYEQAKARCTIIPS